jgi:hypothetical protein
LVAESAGSYFTGLTAKLAWPPAPAARADGDRTAAAPQSRAAVTRKEVRRMQSAYRRTAIPPLEGVTVR